MPITPKQFSGKLKNLRKFIVKNQDRIEIVALNRIHGDITRRIFNDGKATDGALITSKVIARSPRIGAYSKSWGDIRANGYTGKTKLTSARLNYLKKGGKQQTNKVDLEFSGTLRRSIVVGKSGKENVIGFINDKQRIKAEKHEAFRKKEIFPPTKKELDRAQKTAVKEVEFILNKALG